MRPTHRVPGVGDMREITIWKAIVFGILTLGIYLLVLVYQNTKDIQESRKQPFGAWQVVFWVGVFFPLLQYVNYAMNGIGLSELRKQTRQADSSLWIVALVLTLFAIGPFVWAVHYNDTVRTAARAQPTQATQRPAMATA